MRDSMMALTVIIDGKLITEKEDLHQHLATELSLPEYYGNNLDALFDCLTEIAYPVHFDVQSYELLEDSLGQYAVNLILLLRDVSDINPNISFCTDAQCD